MPGSSDTRPEAAVPNKAALVVAAYEFDDPKFQELRSPARDVESLAGVLVDAAIGGFTVQTVVNQPSSVVQQEIERFFSERKPDDLLLLYFSCHGVKDGTGRLYFATTNTSFELLRSTGVSASFVSEQMELTRSKRIVLLLDCCYSGAFLKGFRARGDDAVSVSQLEGRGRAVITASRATEYAFEADELTAANAQPSVFTGAVIEGLATGAADRDGDGSVTVDELYDYVYDHVRGKVAGQTPGRWVNLEGELVIARNPRPPVRPAALSAEITKAVESEVALYRLGAVWQLKDWLGGDDSGRQVTARKVLETLADDYDERVRSAAAAVLAEPVAPDVVVDSVPVPVPAVVAEQVSLPEPLPEPELRAESGSEPAPRAEPEPGAGAGAGAEAESPSPALQSEGGRAHERVEYAIGVSVVAAFVAMVVALFVPFAYYDDGYSERLADDNWNELFVLVMGGLVGYAALCILGQGLSGAVGMTIVLGVMPAVVVFALFGAVPVTDDYVQSVGPGFVLLELSCVTFIVAGLLAASSLRELFTLEWEWASRPSLLAVAALALGISASTAWGEIYEVESGQIWNLILLLVLLTVVVGIYSHWLQRHGVTGRIRVGVTGLAYAGVTLAFVAERDTDATVVAYSSQYAVLVLAAIVVPFLAVLLRPTGLAAVLLAAWSTSLTAEWVGVMFDGIDGNHRGTGTIVIVALLAALPLALLLRHPTHSHQSRT